MPWGHGSLDMLELLRAFDRNGYEGCFSLEYVHPLSFEKPELFTRETRDLFGECLKELHPQSDEK
jgi:protein FrlC